MRCVSNRLVGLAVSSLLVGCGGDSNNPLPPGGATGGVPSGAGGTETLPGSEGGSNVGGAAATGGASSTVGGTPGATGGNRTGGAPGSTGGTRPTGGTPSATGGSGTGGVPLSVGCTPGTMTQTGTLNGRYGLLNVTIGGREYVLQVNEWGSSATQTMAYGGSFFFKMTQQDGSSATDAGPTGFPSMFIGANSGHSTQGSNLPKAVSALTTVPTTWNWNDNGAMADSTNNIFNAAYDVWFSTNSGGDPSSGFPTGGFLMVWPYDPPGAQPIGTVIASYVRIPGVDGQWDIWVGTNNSRPCISYVRTSATKSMSFDLNLFIKDAVANRSGTIQSSWYLTNIFIGFEIWKGSVGVETTNFCAIVN